MRLKKCNNHLSRKINTIALMQLIHRNWLCTDEVSIMIMDFFVACTLCHSGLIMAYCCYFNKMIHVCCLCDKKIEQSKILTNHNIIKTIFYIKLILNNTLLQDLYLSILFNYTFIIRHDSAQLLTSIL